MNWTKLLFWLLVLTSPMLSHAQSDDKLISDLINSAFKQIVPIDRQYYYLHQKGEAFKFDKKTILSYFSQNKDTLKDLPLNEFVEASRSDTVSIDWRKYSLDKARVVDREHLPKYHFSNIFIVSFPFGTPAEKIRETRERGDIAVVATKLNMTKKEWAKLKKETEHKYHDRPWEEKDSFFFSKPIFSKDKTFAVMKLSRSYGGCVYIFKLIGSKWTYMLKYDCFTS